MATRKELYRFAVLLILICTVTDTLTTSRHKRATFVVKALTFAFQQLASFGIDQILNKELDDGTSKKLDNISKSLDTIETKISQGFSDIAQSLKEAPSFVKAREIEAKLLTKMYNYEALLKSFKQSNTGNNQTQETIDEFKKSLREVPDLLFQLDLLITGKSRVAAGLLPGLASSVVDQQLRAMKSASLGVYNVTRTVQEILEYQNILITLQLASIQIYYNNCPDPSSICQIKLNDTYDRIASQVKLFEQLLPGMFMTRGKKSIVYISDTKTNGVLFSNQKSSIVKDGIMDWEKIESPQDAGLRCPRQDANEKWTLEDASGVGRAGFFLKQESGCFLSIDRPFMDYKKSFPLIWTDSDRIDRYKFLICLPNLTPDAVTFFLYADANSIDTTYTLMATHSAIPANSYLKVEEKKTSVYEKINRRLFLTLFLSDKAESWSVGSEITKSTCDESAFGRTVNGGEDNGIKIAIGVGVGVGVLAIIVLVTICICCCG